MRIGLRAAVVAGGFAVALVFIATALAEAPSTATAGSSVNFWIAIDGVGGCSTEQGDATCHIPLGQTFVVDVYLDNAGITYDGYDVALQHQGVAPNHDADSYAWPDCGFPAAAYDEPPDLDVVKFGCAIGINAPGSTYHGLVGTTSFVCANSGAVTVIHGVNKTDILDDNIQGHAEDPNTSETLNISCDPTDTPPNATPAPTPIATFPPPLSPPAFDVDFWIAVAGSPACSTEQGDGTCEFAPGAVFTVDAYVGPLPSTLQSYAYFNLHMTYTGVMPVRDPGGPTGGCEFDEAVVECGGRPQGGFSTTPGILHSVRFECVSLAVSLCFTGSTGRNSSTQMVRSTLKLAIRARH